MKKADFQKKLAFGCTIFLYFLSSIIGGLVLSRTKDYKYDSLTYQINDYNKGVEVDNSFTRPYMRLTRKNETNDLYQDLLANYYYSDRVNDVRQYFQNDIRYKFPGEDEYKVDFRFYSQSTVYIPPEPINDQRIEYKIDYRLFTAYFSDNELGRRGYIGKRFECDSYIFIIDTFANKLCDYYGLENNREGYLQLLSNEEYAVLSFSVDGTLYRYSINNVLYSDSRSAPRCATFNEFFGVVPFSFLKEIYIPCFEFDFKTYSYWTRMLFNDLERLNYTTKDYNFDFFTYDKQNETYMLNENINKVMLDNTRNWSLTSFYILFIISIIGVNILLHSVKNGKQISMLLFIIFISLFIGSFLASYIYVHYLLFLIPLTILISILIQKGSYYGKRVKKTFAFKTKSKRSFYREIEV